VAQGATNVKWVWSPNVRYGAELPLANLYPGSAYVDWLGLDGYNWGLDPHLPRPAWQSFEEIFGATYREVTALAPGNPPSGPAFAVVQGLVLLFFVIVIIGAVRRFRPA